MRIVLNTRILQAPRTGIGQYATELIGALGADPALKLEFFHGWGWNQSLPQAALPSYHRWSAWAKQVPGAYRLRRILEQNRFNRGLENRQVDVYHDPSLWPLDFQGPMVMTLHDLTHVHYPQTQPQDRLAEIHRRLEPALARAKVILADSQFIADEIRLHYGVAAERLKVAPLGYAERFRPRTSSELRPVLEPIGVDPGNYLLCVGTLEPRKNLSLALQAHSLLPAVVRQRYPLLIAGLPGWLQAQFEPQLERALASGSVRLLGYLDDESLASVLAGARMLLFPSRYEGFGLPVLEAMASGVPVVLTSAAALPEVAGAAGCYIDADQPEQCCQAILRLIEDEAEWLSRREQGLLQAQRFSWRKCAALTAEAYRQAMES